MSKPVILLDAGQLVGLSGATSGDVLTWNGTAWVSSPNGNGTVTSVALDTAATGLTVSGGTTQTIIDSGTFTLGGTLGAGYGGTGLGAPVSGDAGKVLTATAGGGFELTTNGAGTVTSITAGDGLDGGTITTSGTISMPNVGTAASYGSASSVPVITTDAQGRVSFVTPTTIAIAQSAVADLVTDLAGKVATGTQVIAGTGLSGGGALSGNVTLSLPSAGTQGTYGSASSVAVVTTDAQGRVSAATTTAIAITQSQVADLVTDLAGKADKSVTATAGTGLTGGGTLAANFSFALHTVGTAASNQGSASKTVTLSTDAYGRVTALSEQVIGSLPASVITSGQIGLARGGTGVDASNVTGGQLLVGGAGVLALQSVSGDASLASTGALTLKNTGTAGTFGSASTIPVFVTDAQGRVTSVTDTSMAIGAGAITSGTLALANGGTNATLTATAGGAVYGTGTALAVTAAGTSGQFLQSNGASAPAWANVTASAPYDLRGMFVGNPASSAIIDRFVADRAVTVSTTTANHQFYCATLPASGTVVLTVHKTPLAGSGKVAMFTATYTAGGSATGNGLFAAAIGTVANNALVAGDLVTVEVGTTQAAFSTPVYTIFATA